MTNDHFKDKAQNWDQGAIRQQNTRTISDAILEQFTINNEMELIDFGVGTGLLGFEIAKHAKKVYGVDTSLGMIQKLQEKNSAELFIEPLHQDIIKEPLERTFDGLVSSMTLHHIEHLDQFFETIYKNIKENGFIAIADLESEDGSFHSDNTGVHHYGFEAEALCKIVEDAGFKNIRCECINIIKKPHNDFGVFLLTASK